MFLFYISGTFLFLQFEMTSEQMEVFLFKKQKRKRNPRERLATKHYFSSFFSVVSRCFYCNIWLFFFSLLYDAKKKSLDAGICKFNRNICPFCSTSMFYPQNLLCSFSLSLSLLFFSPAPVQVRSRYIKIFVFYPKINRSK